MMVSLKSSSKAAINRLHFILDFLDDMNTMRSHTLGFSVQN